jgi:predicted ATPase
MTGLNGSGKSHLLEAIEQKHVVINGNTNLSIVKFDYESFRLDNEAAYSAFQIETDKQNSWNFYNDYIRQHIQNIKTSIGSSYDEISAECKKEDIPLLSLKKNSTLDGYSNSIDQYFNQPHIKSNPESRGVYSLIHSLPFSIDEITEADFKNRYKPFNLKNNFLPQQLGKIIWNYYIKYRQNQINEFENTKYGKGYPFISEKEFIKKNGDKPWDLVNRILKKFNSINYQIASPEGIDVFSNYSLKLIDNNDSSIQIDFSNLSSGEKVLMALVASIYKSSSDGYFPDILLLDEIDATLHPSMMRNMLDVITEEFISRGIKVILVTHSPTTVAFAPEDSIFVMNKRGENRIEKKNNSEALSILTEGFAIIEDGIRLFDQISRENVTVITEGKNTRLFKKAFELYRITNVEVLAGIEGNSGKAQLKTLFDFFTRAAHKKSVVFIWDCDVEYHLDAQNNTIPIVIGRNEENKIATKGIENAFPEELFQPFKKQIISSSGSTKIEFDENRKRDFEEFIISRNNISDFKFMESIIITIKDIAK